MSRVVASVDLCRAQDSTYLSGGSDELRHVHVGSRTRVSKLFSEGQISSREGARGPAFPSEVQG